MAELCEKYNNYVTVEDRLYVGANLRLRDDISNTVHASLYKGEWITVLKIHPIYPTILTVKVNSRIVVVCTCSVQAIDWSANHGTM